MGYNSGFKGLNSWSDGHQTWCGCFLERKKCFNPVGFPNWIVQHVALALYPLRYPDSFDSGTYSIHIVHTRATVGPGFVQQTTLYRN